MSELSMNNLHEYAKHPSTQMNVIWREDIQMRSQIKAIIERTDFFEHFQ